MNFINNLCYGMKSAEQYLNQAGINPRISGTLWLAGTAAGCGTPVAIGMVAGFAVDKLFQAIFPQTDESSPDHPGKSHDWDRIVSQTITATTLACIFTTPLILNDITTEGAIEKHPVEFFLITGISVVLSLMTYSMSLKSQSLKSQRLLTIKNLAIGGAAIVAGTLMANSLDIGDPKQVARLSLFLLLHTLGTHFTQTGAGSLLHNLDWNASKDSPIRIQVKKYATRFLLLCGANINQPDVRWGRHSPFLASVHKNNLDRVQFYLDQGANIHAKDANRCNALCIISAEQIAQKTEIFNVLVDRGINLNQKGWNPLNFLWMHHIELNGNAAQVAHIKKTLTFLVQRGAVFRNFFRTEPELNHSLDWYTSARASVPPSIFLREAKPLIDEIGCMFNEINLFASLQRFYDPTFPKKVGD